MPKTKEPNQEIIEIITEYSVKGISQRAKDKLNMANSKEELLNIYNQLIESSDYMMENGELSIQRQDKFEDEIWDEYKKILKKKFGVKDSMKNFNDKIGKNIKIGDTNGILLDYSNKGLIVQTSQGIKTFKENLYIKDSKEGFWYYNGHEYNSYEKALNAQKEFIRENARKIPVNTKEYYEAEEYICNKYNCELDDITGADIVEFNDMYELEEDIDNLIDENLIEFISFDDLKESREIEEYEEFIREKNLRAKDSFSGIAMFKGFVEDIMINSSSYPEDLVKSANEIIKFYKQIGSKFKTCKTYEELDIAYEEMYNSYEALAERFYEEAEKYCIIYDALNYLEDSLEELYDKYIDKMEE